MSDVVVVEIVTESPNVVEVNYQNIGPQGPSGVVAVTAPLTNSGTASAAQLGLNQSALVVAESQVTNLVADLASKAALSATQTFTGTQTIAPSSASSVGAVVRGAASQTANLQEWQNSSGTPLAKVASNGALGVDTIVAISGSAVRATFSSGTESVLVTSPSPSFRAVVARGAASQTANLQEWQNSAGAVLAKVDAAGTLTTANFMQGTGSPLGVVSASPGTQYVDTANTMGASIWLKMTGTGNTGWIVTVGDTGERDVSGSLTAGLAKSTSYGVANLRRVGNRVSAVFRLDISASLITTLYSPPTGFNTQYTLSRPGQVFTSTASGAAVPNTANNWYFSLTSGIRVDALPNPGSVTLDASWLTSQAWPTSLPGTAA